MEDREGHSWGLWRDRAWRAEAEVERLREMLDDLREGAKRHGQFGDFWRGSTPNWQIIEFVDDALNGKESP